MALIDKNYFKSLPLGLKQNMLPADDVLDVLIEEASRWVEDFCDRKFASAYQEDNRWGSGKNSLMLEHYPVESIQTITWIDDSGTTGTVDVDDVRIRDVPGIIEFIDLSDGPWDRKRFYTINYRAGFSEVPGPVKHATALRVTELLQPQFLSPQFSSPDIIPATTEEIGVLLDRYKRRRLA